MLLKKFFNHLILVISVLSIAASAFALSEEEKMFLSMYFKDEELQVVSATRSLKSIARIAENVEVVTSEDIELMNAHTVAEALYNVTGIEMTGFVGPGSMSQPAIHGSDWTRVATLLDGVPLQNANNAVALAVLPVQMVRKIEVIKGPASATWGSSFGGVINIITKSVDAGDHVGGTVYASGGERNTSDLRAEIYGKKDRYGIYLFGGTMNSDGLRGGHEFWHNNIFAKVGIDAGQKTKIDLSFLYHKSDSVSADYLPLGWDAYDSFVYETIYGKAGLQTSFTNNIDLNVSGWILRQGEKLYENTVSTNARLWDFSGRFDKYGFNGSLAWRSGGHAVVAGTDLMNGRFKADSFPGKVFEQRKYAFFINDTLTINKLSITPGLRYDNVNLGGEMLSPSLGMTYLATKDLLFRAVVSRGFHDSIIVNFIDSPESGYVANKNLKPEKVWSYQAGAEANIADLLRAKLTLFYHDIDDIVLDKDLGEGMFTSENGGGARTTGGEFDISTKKYKGLVLKTGFHYERVKLLDFSDVRLREVSKVYGANAMLTYNEDKGLRAMLKTHYLWWNMTPFWEGKYNGVVVDFNIIKDIIKKKDSSVDIFFTAHNIFNGPSYADILFKNPNRWIEAGVRYKF